MTSNKLPLYAGIDGCPGGWMCAIGNEKDLRFEVVDHIESLFERFDGIITALIDIPIGLASAGITRSIEALARAELKPLRHASIFTPPVRDALYSADYLEACKLNQAITSKKISKQTWNIIPKICEVDEFLANSTHLRGIIKEAHPEICLKYLNNQSLPLYSKHHANGLGLTERRIILEKSIEVHPSIWDKGLPETALNTSSHDQMDATCLFITACLGTKLGLDRLDTNPCKDARGLEMNMYYYNPRGHKRHLD